MTFVFVGIFALLAIPMAVSHITGQINLASIAPQALRVAGRLPDEDARPRLVTKDQPVLADINQPPLNGVQHHGAALAVKGYLGPHLGDPHRVDLDR